MANAEGTLRTVLRNLWQVLANIIFELKLPAIGENHDRNGRYMFRNRSQIEITCWRYCQLPLDICQAVAALY
jgi:hypothetical protein